ncbi:FTR1 family protein [Staphylococcus hominis]|uniref:FTR1 family protein n=1 Tax=Staphylococcus hominis TaxID=1290 RepID=UPI0011A7353E|nr:FTR1 family protein [Staphylococcus hominis]MCI3143115.1 FTR1 family protein [Staphylococcus hominis subsp. hominis]
MKHSLVKISIITLLIIITRLFSLTSVSVANDSQLNDAYVAISDAKSTLEHKQLNYNEKQNVLNEVKHKIMSLNIKENKKGKDVKSKLHMLDQATTTNKQIDSLSELTKSLIVYESSVSTDDINKDIKNLKIQIDTKDNIIQEAIKNKDRSKLQSINNMLNQTWKKHETAIRNYDENKYGQIEVYLMQLRVAIQKEPLDIKKVDNAWKTFKTSIDTVDKKQSNTETNQYKVTQLNIELEKAIKGIENHQLKQSDEALTKFIQIWPYVEGKIQTKNSSLYTKIEDKIPYYQSILDNSNKDRIKESLIKINSEIKDTVSEEAYSSIDVMIIFLREGLEVLLIILTLTTMTRNVRDTKGTTSVIGGAILGLLLSLALALIFIQVLGNNGLLREGMEAALGIIAVVLMYIVGIWMHRRSSAKRWNDMIQQMYHHAISNRNLALLGTIGLISVLREGVEVIIFYMGMMGSIKSLDFVIGIILAIVILIIFTLLFKTVIRLIPIYLIFRVLSILIFIMAFKMLGISIQKLQLLGMITQHSIEHIPTLNIIGFYPSIEAMGAQLIYILLIAYFTLKHTKPKHHI